MNFPKLVTQMIEKFGVIIEQNRVIIHLIKRERMDITALNTEIADLGSKVDVLSTDFNTSLEVLRAAQTAVQTALTNANSLVATLRGQETVDETTIKQLQDELAAATTGTQDFTDQVNALTTIGASLETLDAGVKAAAAPTVPTPATPPPADTTGSGSGEPLSVPTPTE